MNGGGHACAHAKCFARHACAHTQPRCKLHALQHGVHAPCGGQCRSATTRPSARHTPRTSTSSTTSFQRPPLASWATAWRSTRTVRNRLIGSGRVRPGLDTTVCQTACCSDESAWALRGPAARWSLRRGVSMGGTRAEDRTHLLGWALDGACAPGIDPSLSLLLLRFPCPLRRPLNGRAPALLLRAPVPARPQAARASRCPAAVRSSRSCPRTPWCITL